MSRESFCKHHWAYYLALEKDFRRLERFVAFDLGDNYLYTGLQPTNKENSECYLNEFVKQYQVEMNAQGQYIVEPLFDIY